MSMKNIFIACILLLALPSCKSDEEKAKAQAKHDAKIIKQAREDLRKELKAEAKAKEVARQTSTLKNTKLSEIGIHLHNNEITINPEKTKDFFNNLGKKMEKKVYNFTQDLKKGIIEGEDTGVYIDETKINIDLNRTQDFLSTWDKKMGNFVKEIDDTIKSIDSKMNTK